MQAYYREHGINPLSAFAPLLIQIPVFISLYYLMRHDVKNGLFGDSGMLFIPHLTEKPHGAVLVALVTAYLDLADRGQPDRDAHDAGRPARPDAGVAAAVRRDRGALPGRAGGLLDHDQPLDARPAGLLLAPGRGRAAGAGRGAGAGDRGGPRPSPPPRRRPAPGRARKRQSRKRKHGRRR